MERRNGYCDDIRWSKVYFCLLHYSIVLVLGTLFITWMIYEDASSDLRHQQSYNESVEEFNTLPQYKRIIITEWISYEVDENCLRIPAPTPTTFAERFHKCLPYGIIIILVILSIGAFNGYAGEKSCQYFYADFPFDGIRGWAIFILMWACWPILLISLMNLRRWEAKQKAEQEAANAHTEPDPEPETNNYQDEVTSDVASETVDEPEVTNTVEDTQTSESPTESDDEREEDDEDDEEVTYEDLSADNTDFDDNSCNQFVEYCQSDDGREYEKRLRKAKDEVESVENDLRYYGREIQDLQNQLKTAKLELDEVKRSKPKPRSAEELKTEWKAIKNMRGITNIYYYNRYLCIDVAVRVPYEGETYDFGDYTIKINHGEITCPRIRSGVRKDWSGGYPDYCYQNWGEFCLGNRRGSIEDFLAGQRLREAIALVIDCMHSVNDDEDAEDIPNCFRRIVPPKEG